MCSLVTGVQTCALPIFGLWGEGTAFVDREAFTARIRDGGVAAMELVARELKAMGVYTARALSYAGVEYDILEHELTPSQIVDFDTYADAWGILCAAAHKMAYREEAIMRRDRKRTRLNYSH